MMRFMLPLLLALVVTSCSQPAEVETRRLILDTDISSDADDVGAIAVLHELARDERVEILGMMASSGDPWSARTLGVLNEYFGRPGIPIGVVTGRSVTHESSYTGIVGAMLPERNVSPLPSVELYRKLLAAQPDNSVTIVTIGHLTNLVGLLESGADQQSEKSEIELVQQKVKLLVCMGGDYPNGKEWNFSQDSQSTKQVIEQWPTPIVFAGFALGLKVVTGTVLEGAPTASPVRLAYKHHNDFQGRPSWDQLAVLYAAGSDDRRQRLFRLSAPGLNTIQQDGSNVWQSNPEGQHYFLHLEADHLEVAEMIDDMMLGR